MTHRCTSSCRCPVHETPLLYNEAHQQHACQDPECIYAHGFGVCGYPGCMGRFADITDEHKAHHPTPQEISAAYANRRSARIEEDEAIEAIRLEERDALDLED